MDELTLADRFLASSALVTKIIVDGKEEIVAPIFDQGSIYRYNSTTGMWEAFEDFKTRSEIQSFIRATNSAWRAAGVPTRIEATAKKVKGVFDLVVDRLQARSSNFFQEAPRGVLFSNGFFQINEVGVLEQVNLRPKNAARTLLNFPCTEQPTPTWDLMMHRIFEGDPDATDKILVILEFVGAALLGVATKFSRSIVLLGDGSNGKTTLQTVIRALFPPELVITSNPQTWNREYDRAELRGKRLNVTSELPEREMMESEAFKAIVEGQWITARIIRQTPFQYKPEAAHLFAANGLMKTSDFSHGFYRRFIVVPFNNTFTAGEDLATPIIANELPGIAYQALKAVEKAIARNYKFTSPESNLTAIADWKRDGNPVAAFIEECTEHENVPDGTCTWALDLWRSWEGWSSLRGFNKGTLASFSKKVVQILGPKSKIRSNAQRGYKVKLTHEGEKMLALTPYPI